MKQHAIEFLIGLGALIVVGLFIFLGVTVNVLFIAVPVLLLLAKFLGMVIAFMYECHKDDEADRKRRKRAS